MRQRDSDKKAVGEFLCTGDYVDTHSAWKHKEGESRRRMPLLGCAEDMCVAYLVANEEYTRGRVRVCRQRDAEADGDNAAVTVDRFQSCARMTMLFLVMGC